MNYQPHFGWSGVKLASAVALLVSALLTAFAVPASAVSTLELCSAGSFRTFVKIPQKNYTSPLVDMGKCATFPHPVRQSTPVRIEVYGLRGTQNTRFLVDVDEVVTQQGLGSIVSYGTQYGDHFALFRFA